MDDLSHHKYLALRVRSGGNPRTRNSYFVNVKTDSTFSADLWQHRLFFRKDQGQWEDLFVRHLTHIALTPSNLSSIHPPYLDPA